MPSPFCSLLPQFSPCIIALRPPSSLGSSSPAQLGMGPQFECASQVCSLWRDFSSSRAQNGCCGPKIWLVLDTGSSGVCSDTFKHASHKCEIPVESALEKLAHWKLRLGDFDTPPGDTAMRPGLQSLQSPPCHPNVPLCSSPSWTLRGSQDHPPWCSVVRYRSLEGGSPSPELLVKQDLKSGGPAARSASSPGNATTSGRHIPRAPLPIPSY